jgi:hypothetical protein
MREHYRANEALLKMTEKDRNAISHRAASKIYEEWKKESLYAGDLVTGWAGKVS